MSPPDRQGQSTLLLLRLLHCPSDAEAWDQLTQRYGGVIYHWCQRYGLQDADAQDITQDVFVSLLHSLQTFDRNQARFRTWLYTIVHNRLRDWRAAPARRQETRTSAFWQLLDSQEAQSDLETRLSEEFARELLELAERAVQLHVQPNTWAAYQLFCKEQLSLKEAADRIGIPASHVSKYARRVSDRVDSQFKLLEERGETGGEPENGATT